jgi:hypothetical protein
VVVVTDQFTVEEDMLIFSGREFMFSSNGGAQSTVDEIDVDFQVASATAVIEALDVEFSNRHDHHLGRLQASLWTEVLGGLTNRVVVHVDCGLRDWSDGSPNDDLNGDDPINGKLRYSVFIL